MTSSKPAIAFIIPGGIGTGKNNIGVPILESVIKLMTADFNVTVFQLYRTNRNYHIDGFQLIQIYSPVPLFKVVRFLIAFWKAQRLQHFKVIHGFWAFPCGFLAVLVGKIFGLKSVVSLQGGDAISLPDINYGQLQKWGPRKMVLWALHHADELVSPTRYLTDNLRKFGLKRSDIKFIPLGVDGSLFTFQTKAISYPVRLLHIGNLNPVKDQATLLKSFQIISSKISCHLTIIGEGPSEAMVKSMADSLKIKDKISFHDLLPYESLPAYFHEADILMLTSRSEGHPIVVEEAMSSGVVVCGTRVGLLYDLPQCCIAVQVGDYMSLAMEILKLVSDPVKMATLRTHAYEWAGKHSITWTVAQIKNTYGLREG